MDVSEGGQRRPRDRDHGKGGKQKAAKVTPGGPAKGRDKKRINSEEMDELETMDPAEIGRLFPVLMKLVLNLALRTRQVEAITIITLLAPVGLKPVTMARQRVRGWLERIQQARAENKSESDLAQFGTISCAAVVGLVEGLLAEGEGVGRANYKNLQELKGYMDTMNMDIAGKTFALVKVSSARKQTDAKIQMCVNKETQTISNCLEQLGAQRKNGVAPMHHLERIIHTGLCNWEEV